MSAPTPIGSGSFDPTRASGSYASTCAVRAEATYSQTSDIVIHTLDGDTVTLSSSNYDAGGYETYESLAVGKESSVFRSGETAYFESRRQMSIAVTGDLDQKELKEINEIIGTLDNMMKDLSAGNLKGALSRSSRFSGLAAIASFSADLNVTATFTASRYETASTSGYMPGIGGGEDDATRHIDQTADRISSALNSQTALLKNLVSKIADSLSDWVDIASYKSNDHAEGRKWALRFAQRLMDGLKSDMQHEGHGRKG